MNKLLSKRVFHQHGFTLVELMVVVIIIGILAAIAIPVVYKQVDQARIKRAVAEIKTMKTTVDIYRMEKGVFPTTTEVADVFDQAGIDFGSLLDPWDKPYAYYTINATPNVYIIGSGGPDGVLAAGDDDDNIFADNTSNPVEGATFRSLANVYYSGTP